MQSKDFPPFHHVFVALLSSLGAAIEGDWGKLTFKYLSVVQILEEAVKPSSGWLQTVLSARSISQLSMLFVLHLSNP